MVIYRLGDMITCLQDIHWEEQYSLGNIYLTFGNMFLLLNVFNMKYNDEPKLTMINYICIL